MARPEQRKRRANKDPDQQSHAAVYQVLPLANLPVDFAGQPVDGLEYLAWAKKGDSELPLFVSAPNPYALAEAEAEAEASTLAAGLLQGGEDVGEAQSEGRMISSNGIFIAVDQPAVASSTPSSSRHPDLWKESWAAAFAIHWRNYRHYIQSLPLTPQERYLVPLPTKRPAWETFIHGAPRRLKADLAAAVEEKKPKRERVGSCDLSEFGIDEDVEKNKVVVQVDEEEEMRALNEGDDVFMGDEDCEGKGEEDDEEEDDELYEPYGPRHMIKEPTMSMIRCMNQQHHLVCIAYLTQYMTNQLSRLPLPSDSHLLSTQPGQTAASSINTASFPSTHPFPPLHAQWSFAALACLSPHLTSDSLSTIRSFARAATEFAEWLAISIRRRGDDVERNDALANCWIVLRGVGVEWGQSDLIEDAERTFSKIR